MRTQEKVNCLNCGKEFQRWNGRPNSKFCCRKCSMVYRYKQNPELGKIITEKAHEAIKNGAVSRENHYKWNPNKGESQYVKGEKLRQHREIMEKILGRKLARNEVVHHINGDKSDNRPENLVVMSRRDHTRYHNYVTPM